MEGFLNRYRSITVLLLVIFAQLILVAVGAKTKQDVRLIRVWSVSAVSPVARLLEGARGGGIGFLRRYVMLHDAENENRRLRDENGKLKLDNIFLKNELGRADRARAKREECDCDGDHGNEASPGEPGGGIHGGQPPRDPKVPLL